MVNMRAYWASELGLIPKCVVVLPLEREVVEMEPGMLILGCLSLPKMYGQKNWITSRAINQVAEVRGLVGKSMLANYWVPD